MRFARKYNSEPFEVTCLRCREDPLPQTPYVVLGGPPIDRVPIKEVVLRSVHHNHRIRHRRRCHCHGVQLVLRFRCRRHRHCTGSPDPRQHPFGSGIALSGQLSGTVDGGADGCPGFLLPFGHRHSLLGSSLSRRGIGSSSRSTDRTHLAVRTLTGLPRSTRTSCGRGGCLLYPEGGGAPPGRPQIPDRRLPLPNGQPLNPASNNPSAERI